MKLPEGVPRSISLEARGKDHVAIRMTVERGLRFWLPRELEVTMERAGGIWFYQTLHKLLMSSAADKDWSPNVAAAGVELGLLMQSLEGYSALDEEGMAMVRLAILRTIKHLGLEVRI